MGERRLRVPDSVLVVLLVALVAGCAWSLGLFGLGSDVDSGDDGDRAELASDDDEEAPGERGSGSTEPAADRLELIAADYDPGDCVMYETDSPVVADTDVVPCTEDHRLQISSQTEIDVEGTAYPTDEEWRLTIEAECRPAAEAFLGRPLDPYGRFVPRAVFPTEEGWERGDRDHIWCAIGDGSATASRNGDLFAEDVRDADPALRHRVGTCLSTTSGSVLVVECTQPHDKEIVGQVDLRGRTEPPAAQDRAVSDECTAHTRSYLGIDPAAPWQIGWDEMAEESWAAGSRVVHCFLGQWDAQRDLVEVTDSAKG